MSAPTLRPGEKFDIPDVPDFIPRPLKPWLFIIFVLIVQFSGGVYLAAASDMVGTTALMQEDILMAGYSQLIGMAINFAVMFRIKFRFSNRTQLLVSAIVLSGANAVCTSTDSALVLSAVSFVAGWFRMQATFACNSTIQLWLTPVRDMSVFFCYVYLVVDGIIQLSGLSAVYSAFAGHWADMQIIMSGLLALLMIMVIVLVRPVHVPLHIPLLGIDWLGGLLWGGFMMAFTFICVYGPFYDWWDAQEIKGAALIGAACLGVNLWRATFLHHPYVSFMAMRNHNVVRATAIYMVFFTLLATEHVFEHTYAINILGFDKTNAADLNWYVLWGIFAGVMFTYLTFAQRRWRYKTMTAISFGLAAVYLAYFYLLTDYGIEKEALMIPLFFRGAASVILSIVLLTSIVQSGLPFMIFPQALTINGFTGAVMGATFGPAIVGEMLRHILARNISQIWSGADGATLSLGELYGLVSRHALAVTIKEIYGLLLIVCLISLGIILVSYGPMKPAAIFPKWRTIRRLLRHSIRLQEAETAD